MEVREFKAKTVDEAITAATLELGISSDQLEYKVIDEGSKGFLGIFNTKPAVISVTVKKSLLERTQAFCEELFDAMKVETTVNIDFKEEDNVMNIALGGVWGSYSIGKVTVKDKDNNIHTVFKDDERFVSGELVGIQKNKVSVIDKAGNRLSVSIEDPRYLSGELQHTCKGRKWVHNKITGQKLQVHPNDVHIYISKGFQHGKGKIRKTSSQTGMKLVHKGAKNTRIKHEDLEKYLNNGWNIGWPNIKERRNMEIKKDPKVL